MGEVKAKLLHILMELHPEVDFDGADRLVDGGILDSFDIVDLVTEIDDCFAVRITAAELIPEHFNSVDGIAALIERHLAGA